MPLRSSLALAFALTVAQRAGAQISAEAPPDANATIRAAAGPSDIVITTTDRLADVAVGTLEDVRRALVALTEEFAAR